MHTSFNILVTGCPNQSQAHLCAIRFIKAALLSGHSIKSVFFYQDAVHVANKYTIKPNDEFQLKQYWIELSKKHEFELQICLAASNRRGVISSEEAKQINFNDTSLDDNFSVTGLGQLAAAFANSKSDSFRHIQFK